MTNPSSSSDNNQNQNGNNQHGGNKPNSIFAPFWYIIHFINHHIVSLNSSKFFAGMIIILINIGSKFITVQFSKSTEEYLKYTISKQILIFGMAWMGTRDIYAAFGITAVLTILSDYLFNEESALCVIPHKYRVLHTLIDTNKDGYVSDAEISAAMALLEKAKREKHSAFQRSIYTTNFL